MRYIPYAHRPGPFKAAFTTRLHSDHPVGTMQVSVSSLIVGRMIPPRLQRRPSRVPAGDADSHPLAVLVVTIAAGSLFGMVGLILAAPLTSAAVHISRDLALARAAVRAEA
jgi:predicted PurR-regulated permease PerM